MKSIASITKPMGKKAKITDRRKKKKLSWKVKETFVHYYTKRLKGRLEP